MTARIFPISSNVLDMDLDTLFAAQIDKVLTFSQNISTDLATFKKAAGDDIDCLEVAVQDVNLKTGNDPGLSDIPLFTACEGISFVNSVAQDAIQSSTAEMANVKHIVSTLEQS